MDARSDAQPQLGKYRVVGSLGDGALGRVLLGEDPIGRRVAITVVRPGLAAEAGFRERFREEVRTASSAPPWFVAAVLDADPDAVSPWLVTAFVDGPTLRAYLGEHGPLGEAGLSALAIRTADGLAALHGPGLVHRDLRPTTLLLAQDGPRLIGLGVGQLLDATARTGRPITALEYRSPEQAAGAGPVGTASDMFSFGAVLGYAATGHSPFAADTPAAALLRVIEAEPDLDGLTGAVRDVVAACLTKDPARRPTAGQVAGMLRAAEAAANAPTLTHRSPAPPVTPSRLDPATSGRPDAALPPAPVDLGKRAGWPAPDAEPTLVAEPAPYAAAQPPGSALPASPPPGSPFAPRAGQPTVWQATPGEPAPWQPVSPRRRTMPIVAIVLVGILVGAILAYAIVRGAAGGTPTVTASAAPPPAGAAPAGAAPDTRAPAADPAAGTAAVDPSTLGVDGPHFSTPSHNIVCRMSQTDGSARCDVGNRAWQLPPQPASCTFSWGRGAQVTGTDAGMLTCASDTVADPTATVLQYGQSVASGGIVCVSRDTGVRCTNTGTQHGFGVSRSAYDLF